MLRLKKISLVILVSALTLGLGFSAYAAETLISDSDIEYFSLNSAVGSKLMEISDQLRAAKRNGASEEELNELAAELLGTSASPNPNSLRTALDLDSYITQKLNSQEQALYDRDTAKALLCLSNGVQATNDSKNAYNTGLYNGNGDAYRHTIWNFGMVMDVGYDFAKEFSDAHEYGTPNNPELEKTMDLYNNGVGLESGKNNPNTVLHSIRQKKTAEKVDGGYCRIINNGKLVWSDTAGKK